MLKLILRNLMAHKLRSLMTVGSVTLAVFLICILQAIVAALLSATSEASKDRLIVQSAVSLYVDLPLAYEPKIADVEGVERICKWQWFGGQYGEEQQPSAQFGCDPGTLLPMYPEMSVIDGSYEEFERNRRSCMIGTLLAEQKGFTVGQTLQVKSGIFERTDGSAWEFEVAGIYESSKTSLDEQTMFFHFDYLREAIEAGVVRGRPSVGVYVVALADGASATEVSADIDALFENGPQRVQTTTEAVFSQQFVSMLGNVPFLLRAIGGAVIFAIFFAILNTMLMAGRERTRDIGVLKAMGFTNGFVFWGLTFESLLLCSIGGAAGIGLAVFISPGVAKNIAAFVPGFGVDDETILLGIGLALGLGILAGIVPARNASRLQPVAALRTEG